MVMVALKGSHFLYKTLQLTSGSVVPFVERLVQTGNQGAAELKSSYGLSVPQLFSLATSHSVWLQSVKLIRVGRLCATLHVDIGNARNALTVKYC